MTFTPLGTAWLRALCCADIVFADPPFEEGFSDNWTNHLPVGEDELLIFCRRVLEFGVFDGAFGESACTGGDMTLIAIPMALIKDRVRKRW